MVQVTINEKTIYIDGYLKTNLDTAKSVVKKDWDMVFVIDGAEGSGKSVIAQQIATYCDPTFNIERIAFKARDFVHIVTHAKQYEAVIFDEAFQGLSARTSLQQTNIILIKMLAEIRQKNLFVFIVMPTFFDIDRNIALWRSRALINVYTDNWERGFFKFYNADKKRNLYVNGKKFYSYAVERPNFIGRFTNAYMVEEEEYRKRKLKALNDYELRTMSKDEEQEFLVKHLEKIDIPIEAKAAVLHCKIRNYNYLRQKYLTNSNTSILLGK